MSGSTLFAVPTNVGPRTMPDYEALAKQGIYTVQGDRGDIRVFAGTVADPFFIDLGAAFDTFNFRTAAGGGVLTAAQDKDNHLNLAPNAVSGFNVNTIAIEVPINYLTTDGNQHKATDAKATIGAWATTSRAQFTIRRSPTPPENFGNYSQIQRLGNPLINELIIGTGYKDTWSMSQPVNDSQFRQLRSGSDAGTHLQRGLRNQHSATAAHRSASAGHLRPADCRSRHTGRPGGRPAAAEHRCGPYSGG